MDVKIERPDVMRENWLMELKMTMSQDKMKLIVKQENISSDHDSVKDGKVSQGKRKDQKESKKNKKKVTKVLVSHHAQKIESKAVESQIRKIEDNERPSFKRGMELEWVQLCPHCNMWVGRLVEHMKSAHPDLDYHMIKTKCPFEPCDRSVVDIENHIRLVHDKVRNFSCEKCDAKFTSSHHLLKHTEAAHTNIRVECNLCGKVFKSTTIENHIKRVHHGIKVFHAVMKGVERLLAVKLIWKDTCLLFT